MSSYIRTSFWQPEHNKRAAGYLCYVLEGLGGAVLIGIVFYNSLWAALPLGVLIPPYVKLRKDRYDKRKKNELLMQFREGLNAVSVALRAGYSVENSFLAAAKEMRVMYGQNAGICSLFGRIEAQLAVNKKVEDILSVFADDSGIPDIIAFSEVFSYAKRSGGNMVDIIQDTAATIGQKADTAREISVLISEKQLEQAVMDVVPMGIIIYLRVSAPELIGRMYGNTVGVVAMTLCLAVYMAAVVISLKISDIRV